MEAVGYLSLLLKHNPKAQDERLLYVFQQLDAMGGGWRKRSQGDKSKTREVLESKRRACFKEDKAFNGVKFTGEGWRCPLDWHNGGSWRLCKEQ